MKACHLALLSSLLLAVSADIVIKKPYGSTVWDFNSKENPVKWTHTDDETGSKELHLFYTAGVDPRKYKGKPIASETVDDITADSYKFDLTKLDKSQFPPEQALYFLRFGGRDGSYSHLFSITGGQGDKVTEVASGSDDASNTTNNDANTSSNTANNAANNAANTANNAANNAANTANNAANNANNAANNAANTANNAANNAANTAANTVPGNSTAPQNGNTVNGSIVNGNSTATTGQNGSATVNQVVSGNSVATSKPTPSGAMKTATTSFAAIALAVAAFLL